MTGFIYKITNNINGKCYIGKTLGSIEKRWKEHQYDSTRRKLEVRPLYRAFNKYGIENFSIEQIEECDVDILSEREIYWINYYNSYHYGYNATFGGDGKQLFDYNEILEELKKTPYLTEVARKIGCCVDTVRIIAHKNNIKVENKGSKQNVAPPKAVYQYSLDGEFIQEFSSTMDAGRWLVSQGKAKAETSRTHISEVCRGLRSTAYGYKWKYADSIDNS